MSFPCPHNTPEVDMAEANKALERAKIALMSRPDSTFFTTVCFSLHHKFSESVPTAATNGRMVYYNPDFFTRLSQDEQVFLLLHETLHCAFLHMDRLKEFEPQKWNMAADYVINDMLLVAGYVMPQGGLHDPQYREMHTEEVYKLLPDPPPSFAMDLQQPGSGDGSGQDGNDPSNTPMTKEEMDDILVRAQLQSRMAGDKPGSVPGQFEIYLNELLDPKLPWAQILRRYITRMVKSDYTFRRPNRRFFPEHILPTQYSQGLAEIAVAVDTSGSVSDEEFQDFVNETHGILKQLKPKTLTFIQFDTQIKSIDVLEKASDIKSLRFTGRGGTCIQPVMDWAQKHQPTALLMFTDGYFSMTEAPGKVPVIWVIHSNDNFNAPFGSVISYNFKK